MERVSEATLARDRDDNVVLLLQSTWPLRYFGERNPALEILESPPRA